MPNSQIRQIVLTDKAPQPIGPYSQAVRVGEWLFCSGQIAIDPKDGQIHASDVEGQTKQVLENLKAVLEAGGAKCSTVVKTTIFLKSMGDFPKVNEIYGAYFRENPPARSTVEVSRLPKDVLVEVEAIARVEG
jgi:2-iminobutanoate/2-iminopropanoate deaminase